MKDDHAPLLAAGVAFYGLLALVPGLIAMLSLYGLVADPTTVEDQAVRALKGAPNEVRDMVAAQLTSIADSSSGKAVTAVVVGIAVALWSASSGIGHLVDAVNIAYDVRDRRGFVRRRGLALLLTLGTVVFLVATFALIALVPRWLDRAGLGGPGRLLADVARWVLLLGGVLLGLAIVYRVAPDREDATWRWISPGAAVAAGLWLVGSLALSVYSANIGRFNETYGSLGAVIVVMLWLLVGSLAVIVGAELNCELDRQAPPSPDS